MGVEKTWCMSIGGMGGKRCLVVHKHRKARRKSIIFGVVWENVCSFGAALCQIGLYYKHTTHSCTHATDGDDVVTDDEDNDGLSDYSTALVVLRYFTSLFLVAVTVVGIIVGNDGLLIHSFTEFPTGKTIKITLRRKYNIRIFLHYFIHRKLNSIKALGGHNHLVRFSFTTICCVPYSVCFFVLLLSKLLLLLFNRNRTQQYAE